MGATPNWTPLRNTGTAMSPIESRITYQTGGLGSVTVLQLRQGKVAKVTNIGAISSARVVEMGGKIGPVVACGTAA
jgi:hypothetical protein